MNPADFFAAIAAAGNILDVLTWVGAGIMAACGLYFVLRGIQKGLSWFFAIIEERKAGSGLGTSVSAARPEDLWHRDFREGRKAGYSFQEATSFADDMADQRDKVYP